MSMPVQDIKGVKVKNKSSVPVSMLFSLLPALPRMSFYGGMTVAEYAARFKSPLLRRLLETIIGPDMNATGMIFTIATLTSGDGGYPEGGSLGMAKRMAQRFQALGGVIRYGKLVEKVIVEGGEAKGVTVDGERVGADAVIVTQDTRAAIDALFDAPIRELWAEAMRKNTEPLLDTFVSVGFETDLSGLPARVDFFPERPVVCGGISYEGIGINNYAGWPGYAPEGCTAVTSAFMGDSYDFWKSCRENGTYEQEKEKLAQALIGALAEKFPQTAGKAAVWDVATPLTYERYLHSYKGSWMTKMSGGAPAEYPSKSEGIGRLYFAGQRLRSPGGLPVALDSGRKAAQFLCRDADTVFQGKM